MDTSLTDPNVEITSESNEKFDYNYFYEQAKNLEKEGTIDSLESCVMHIEAALDNLSKVKPDNQDKKIESWLKKFREYEMKVKTTFYRKKIKYLTDRAEKEEDVYKYDDALKDYREVKEIMNDFYKLGNNKITKDDIKKNQSKINDLETKLSHEEQIKQISESKSEVEENETDFEEINADVEIVNFDEDNDAQVTLHTPPPEEFVIEQYEIPMEQEETPIEQYELEPEEAFEDDLDQIIDDTIYTFEEKPPAELSVEILKENEINLLMSDVRKTLEAANYYVIPSMKAELQEIYKLIDFLAIKILHINEFLDILQVVPVKISKLRGNLIVSDTKIKYSNQNSELSREQQSDLANMLSFKVKKVVESISTDLEMAGPIVQELMAFLDEDIYLEKNKLAKKNYFYRNGRMQYKFVFQPIIVSHNKVGFLEKNIPYAFQQSTRSYFVQLRDLSDLLIYLKAKHNSLEKVCVKKQPIELFLNNKIKLSNGLRLMGAILGAFGLILLISIIFANELLISMLLIVQYPLLAGIGIFLLLILNNYRKNQENIVHRFNLPFGVDHPDFNNKKLILSMDQINPTDREQFLYEIYKKKAIPMDISKKISSSFTFSKYTELFATNIVNLPANPKKFSELKEVFRIFEQNKNFMKAYCVLRAILILKMRYIIINRLNKPEESVNGIHNITKLLQIIIASKIIAIDEKLEKEIKDAEKIRKNKGVITHEKYDTVKKSVLKLMKNIQEGSDSRTFALEIDESSNRESLKVEENYSIFEKSVSKTDSIREFLEDD